VLGTTAERRGTGMQDGWSRKGKPARGNLQVKAEIKVEVDDTEKSGESKRLRLGGKEIPQAAKRYKRRMWQRPHVLWSWLYRWLVRTSLVNWFLACLLPIDLNLRVLSTVKPIAC
jgi:hypothetical protein